MGYSCRGRLPSGIVVGICGWRHRRMIMVHNRWMDFRPDQTTRNTARAEAERSSLFDQ